MIRDIVFEDYNQLEHLLAAFAQESGLAGNTRTTHDRRHGEGVIKLCRDRGVAIVYESQGRITGLLLAARMPDIWFPKTIRLQELIWYVDPEYRSTTQAGRLLKEYQRRADAMISREEIMSYTVGRTRSTVNIDYTRHGFKELESIYVNGE